jgi:opacity protein-like surface antigen
MDGEYEYRLVTPWKFNLSTGYTFGSVAAFGVEYEYSNYSSAKLKDVDGITLEQTDDIKSMMKGVHTFRAGVEFKLAPEFAFRLGYNHITASMKPEAYKWIQSNSIRTDTEYSNLGATNNYTLGFGYRGSTFYADMAYQYNTYKESFYAFDNLDLRATEITNNNHKVLLTVGMRF